MNENQILYYLIAFIFARFYYTYSIKSTTNHTVPKVPTGAKFLC